MGYQECGTRPISGFRHRLIDEVLKSRILEESDKMILDSSNRLGAAVAQLRDLVVSPANRAVLC